MAKETQPKKRKSSAPADQVEKVKKVKKVASEVAEIPAKKRKATEDAAQVTTKKFKTPKSTSVESAKTATKSHKGSDVSNNNVEISKASKPAKDIPSAGKKVKAAEDATDTKIKMTKQPKSRETTEQHISLNHDEDDDLAQDDEDDLSEDDDQTEALLKGFESDGDEEDATNDGGLKPGQDVPKIPTLNNKSKKLIKRLGESETADKPGVVYVGRIPHGFYENEMKAYFNQFGNILKLRMSRNRKTGNSKHMAWIQFESATVAEIVAKAMDNYLLFNHILKVKVVPDEQIPPNLFKGANKRFKKVPWNKIEGRRLEQGASEETWGKRIEKEERRRDEKAKKLEDIGYAFDAPKIKSAKNVAKKQSGGLALTAQGEGSIEALPAADETVNEKKKGKKTMASEGSIEALPAADETVNEKKKGKKTMASEGSNGVINEIAATAEESVKLEKEKKSTRVKGVEPSLHATSVPDAEEPSKPKQKKEKKVKAAKSSEAADAEAPLKEPKPKKAKTAVVDESAAVETVSDEKTKKSKKSKKVKAVA